MRYLYFADPMDDIKAEGRIISRRLHCILGKDIKLKTTDLLPFDRTDFDVLFFDWGGMSIGNSMSESFCREIIEHAREHPSKLYIMNSDFSRRAMVEVQSELKLEHEIFNNIFNDIDDASELLKEWDKS